MRGSVIVALALATALPACAQRGAGHASFAAHGASAPRIAPAFRSFGPRPATDYTGAALVRAPYAQSQRSLQPLVRYAPAVPARRAFYTRQPERRRFYPNRGSGFYSYPVVIPGYSPILDSAENYDAFDPDDPNNDTAQTTPPLGNGYSEPAPGPYDPNPVGYPAESQVPAELPYGPAPQPPYAPASPEPLYAPVSPQPAATPEMPPVVGSAETITLVFKDGRPPEQIQNFLATRTTLTVIDGRRHHDIPIAALDLVATTKLNHEAGVDFQLPNATP